MFDERVAGHDTRDESCILQRPQGVGENLPATRRKLIDPRVHGPLASIAGRFKVRRQSRPSGLQVTALCFEGLFGRRPEEERFRSTLIDARLIDVDLHGEALQKFAPVEASSRQPLQLHGPHGVHVDFVGMRRHGIGPLRKRAPPRQNGSSRRALVVLERLANRAGRSQTDPRKVFQVEHHARNRRVVLGGRKRLRHIQKTGRAAFDLQHATHVRHRSGRRRSRLRDRAVKSEHQNRPRRNTADGTRCHEDDRRNRNEKDEKEKVGAKASHRVDTLPQSGKEAHGSGPYTSSRCSCRPFDAPHVPKSFGNSRTCPTTWSMYGYGLRHGSFPATRR